MKICITSQGKDLNSQVDMRFGRAQFFIIVDTDTMKSELVENQNVGGSGGVGIQTGQLMVEKDVKVVLTGNVGPNAFRVLESSGINVYTGVSGIVSEVIERYKRGEFTKTSDSTVPGHFGISENQTTSSSGTESKTDNVSVNQSSKQEELKILKEELLTLTEQIKRINKQIDDLGSN